MEVIPFADKLYEKLLELTLSPSSSSSKNTILSIGTATSFVFAYSLYNYLCVPPRNLRHIPHASFLKYTLRSLQKVPYTEIENEVTMPLLDPAKGEMYLKSDRLGWTVNIAHPEAAKVFFLKTEIFPKANLESQKGTMFTKFLGMGNILFSNGELWKKHRKLVNPSFHRQMPVKLFGELSHKVLKVLDEQEGQPVDVYNIMERFTLDAIGRAGFGFDFNAILEEDNEWVETYDIIKNSITDPMFFMLPFLETKFLWLFPERQRKHRVLQKFHRMMESIIEHKRKVLQHSNESDQVEDAEKDILTLMLESELAGEGALTNEELKSDLNVFFIAGHETSSSALSFVIGYMARDPALQQRAREEAIAVLGDTHEDVLPTIEQVKKFDFIHQVIKEALRMNPPIPVGIIRQTSQDTELVDNFIPKGTPIVVNAYDIHHSPFVWKDPERFDPDRFAPGGEAEQQARGSMSWIPFYHGQRMCAGMNFSLIEQKVILPNLLRKYEWCLPDDSIHKDKMVTETLGIMVPRQLKVIFKRRY